MSEQPGTSTQAITPDASRETVAKRSATVDLDARRIKAQVDPSSLVYKQLREDAFWQRIPAWAEVDRATFIDYRWQMRNSVQGGRKFFELLDGWVSPAFLEDVRKGLALATMTLRVTPYILSLIDWDNPLEDPIRRQFIPVASAMLPDHPMLTLDSLEELVDSPVPGLTHRYVDKALFLALDTCPVYCRFCTRSYAIGIDTDTVEKVSMKVDPKRWEAMFDYIASRVELEDIVISGGDAFNLAAKHIETIGMRLLAMPNVRRIRVATKGPAVMPMKVLSDNDWLDALTRVSDHGRKLHKQVAVHTHFGNASEITGITRDATNRFIERGIVVRNQSVLQRGVNDDIDGMRLLIKRLGEVNVEPYYVFQHDMVQGVEDLRTSVAKTCHLSKGVQGITAGFNVPNFIVDAPGGGGKRNIHSYEHYDPTTGVSVYTAPAVRPGDFFFYFDPLHCLAEDVQKRWMVPAEAKAMVQQALEAARG